MEHVATIDQLPRQAWLVRFGRNGVAGVAGSDVKLGAGWLFEGGWAETDHPRELRASGIYLGSGAVWDGTTLSLIAPSHSADAVYLLRSAAGTYASNSLPFVMAASGLTDLPLAEIGERIKGLVKGLRQYPREIYAGDGVRLYRFFNAIIQCRADAEPVEIMQEADLSGVRSYETYREYLISVIRQASRNYGSAGTTVYLSSGYDSTACAALATRCGGECLAVTINEARNRHADDGRAAARALGMPIVSLERPERQLQPEGGHKVWDHVTEADIERLSDFYVGIGVADECLYAPAELLARRTILTGFHGDKIWDPLAVPTPDLVRGDPSGASMGEFRLRVGFLHIPVPMLAFGAHSLLQQIGLSKEMRPWRKMRTTRIGPLRIPLNPLTVKAHPLVVALGRRSQAVRAWRCHGYDRPIPRRMAEEMGVPRKAFGQRKKAASTFVRDLDALSGEILRRLISRYEPALARLPRFDGFEPSGRAAHGAVADQMQRAGFGAQRLVEHG
jgi:hypothetical protein